MSYKALYREFRPIVFSDVVGQEHITDTLKNQIKLNRVAHAYLFSGGRGSGKTTTAKILARAVNCLNPINGEPCNECEICKQSLEGSLTDVSEIDAASNNGVDNIRDIREEVEYVPTNSKYRVYIIDEVHMLSTGAFNALLKTLEEPPEHVIFILATTEPQKLPVTILSRCQRFDFRRISIENIMKRLNYICTKINVEAEEKALNLIAKMSDGAMRDAISLLDRCVADGDTKITENQVRKLVGTPEFEFLVGITQKIIMRDVNAVLEYTSQIINEGKDIEFYTWELIKFIRDLIVFNTTLEINAYDEEEKKSMKSLLESCNATELLNLISDLSEIQNNMKWAIDKEVMFETGIVKFMISKVNKKEELKTKIESEDKNNSAVSNNENLNDDLKIKVLTNLKENRKMIMYTILSNAQFKEVSEDLIHILFSKNIDDVNKQYMQKEESKILIKEIVKNIYSKEMKIKYVF